MKEAQMMPAIGRGILVAASLLIATSAAEAQSESMKFRVARLGEGGKCGASCPVVVVAEGTINSQTPAEFLAFAKQVGRYKGVKNAVILNSPGGQVYPALQLGMMLRRIGTTVIIARAVGGGADGEARFLPGGCMSACVYTMMGGKTRVVPPQSMVGIHRMHRNAADAERPSNQPIDVMPIRDALRSYVSKMGVDPSIVALAERTSEHTIYYLKPNEIKRFRLAKDKL
jgi:hypothetical protein